MPDNKNQSARWPSVTGGSVTGRINLQNYSPNAQRQALLANLRKQKFGGEMSLNDMLARQLQGVANSKIANEERLAITRQSNLQRMADLYGNYFQEFGGVLNERALAFLDHHSKINVPTFTAIMAGYEHARASAADRELMALQKQEQLLKEAQAVEQERVALANQRLDNNASVVQSNIAQAAKSYSDYMGGLISDAGGAIGGSGRGGGGTGGVGGRGGALGYDGGGANIAGGARTGTSALVGEGAVDTKAEQTGVQGAAQLGPLATQVREEAGGIAGSNGLEAGSIGLAATGLGWALNKYGNRAQLGYLDKQGKAFYDIANSDYLSFKNQTDIARLNLESEEANIRRLARSDPRFSRHANMERYLRGIERRHELRMNYINQGKAIPRGLQDSPVEAQIRNRLQRANSLRGSLASATITERQGLQVRNLIADQFLGGQSNVNIANKATTFQRGRGLVARGAGKLLGKVLGPVALALEAYNWADETAGFVGASGKWAADRVLDYFGSSGRGLTWGQYYDEIRNSTVAAENQFFNAISGGRLNVGLEDADVQQAVGRLRELGWGGEGSEWDQNNFEINQIIQMKNQDPDSFYKALDALYQYDPQTHGNIAPFEYFQRAASQAAFDRTYAAQANKVAQDRQISEQQMMQEQRNAMLAEGLSPTEQGIAQQIYDYAAINGEEVDFEDILATAHLFHDEVMVGESGGRHGIEGDMTSDGTAKSAYQIKDKTFQWFQKALLQDDDRSGGQLLNPQQREVLRAAKNANDLDRDEIGQSVLRAFPLYHLWKENINIGKFGKGNPNISAIDAFIEVAKIHRNMGRQENPYVIGNLDALRRAVHGRFFDTEENKKAVANMDLRLQNNFQTPQGWWSQRNGAFMMSNDVSTAMQQVRPQIVMSQYIKKLNKDVDFDNLNPIIKRQLNAIAEELGQHQGSIQLNSGTRDKGRNDFLIKMHEEGRGKEFGLAYKPSRNSKHLTGDAIDIQIDQLDKFVKGNEELKKKYKDGLGMMASYGFDNSVKGDHVHFTLNKKFAEQPTLSVPQFKQYMIPIESTYSEPPPQTVVAQNPWGVDFLGQYIPEVGQYQGSIQIGQEQPDFRTFTLDQQQGQQQQQQLEVVIGWDEDGNPVYQ